MKNKILLTIATGALFLIGTGTVFADSVKSNVGVGVGVGHLVGIHTNVDTDADGDNGGGMRMGKHATTTPPFMFQGNGQPITGGTVTAVSSTTVTIVTATGNVTYNVNATGASIIKGKATSTISAIIVGDKVLVQGSVSGTSITASTIFDQTPKTSMATTTPEKGGKGFGGKFMTAFGGFFHFFGFF